MVLATILWKFNLEQFFPKKTVTLVLDPLLLVRIPSASSFTKVHQQKSKQQSPGTGEFPGSLGPKTFRLDQIPSFSGGRNKSAQGASVKFSESSTQAVIKAAYLQVFGRDVYEGQRLKVAEIKLENGEIPVREFIRQLAKSDLFRSLYWTRLYVTKAVEYIHRRLLGRPTYGRQEINRYFDICAKQGFYALIDALIDSPEFSEVFGEDTVPYERYLTPAGVALRSLRVGSIAEDIVSTNVEKSETPRFVELGQVASMRMEPDIQFRINQGVSKQREQTRTFKLTDNTVKTEVQTVIRAPIARSLSVILNLILPRMNLVL